MDLETVGINRGEQVISKREQFIRKQLLLFLKKNDDYGNSYRDVLDEVGASTFKVVALFKLHRLSSLMGKDNREVVDEGITDTVADLFNYTAMTYVYYEYEDDCIADLVYAMGLLLSRPLLIIDLWKTWGVNVSTEVAGRYLKELEMLSN